MICPLALLALTGAALAADQATTTVDAILLPGFNGSDIALSVISARPEATTYAIGKSETKCQLNKPRDNEAICTNHLKGGHSKATLGASATQTITDFRSHITPVLVTGGVEKLSQSSSQAASSAPSAALLCGLGALVAAIAIRMSW
ncbi:hypothetical protein CDD80_2548 [Ophiocordyceps camponoti-rufipedis]|uniref:Uncharacterized protein n=1 Tax=Ophiocordyceps camponoti-rufipedis TaxID=2004952 RepID=A0A2C5ZGN1_9HYPO|nr:hypothetical protein CDD80_2548 [Ophiocordyceps camponoti-rufipedis]